MKCSNYCLPKNSGMKKITNFFNSLFVAQCVMQIISGCSFSDAENIMQVKLGQADLNPFHLKISGTENELTKITASMLCRKFNLLHLQVENYYRGKNEKRKTNQIL